MINAPALVLTAAGLSIIAKGGLGKSIRTVQDGKDVYISGNNDVLQFWVAIIAASGGIILIDRWNSDLAAGLASLWIVGGVLSNGDVIGKWLKNLGRGLENK